MGRGTAHFYLNDKVVKVCNALHVPGLRAPLYLLRRHRHMFDCGYYSQFGVGSFILFPNFTIQVDDSEDIIVSFKAIGRSPCKRIDYKEPKYPQARPAAHLIPEDDMKHISFHIPDPKARPLPTEPPPTEPQVVSTPSPTDDSIVISDEELTASASKPLTKCMVSAIHDNPSNIQPVPPQYTPAPSENTTTFNSLQLHRIFGCRRFKNQLHITSASQNATLFAVVRCRVLSGIIQQLINLQRGNHSPNAESI